MKTTVIAASVTLSTPRSRYAHEFALIASSGLALTTGQSKRAAETGCTHVCRFHPARPAWLARAARAAGYEAHVLGYTNDRKHGGASSETVGLAPL